MEDEEMGPGGEESETMIRQKSEALASALNALASAASKLSSRSRGIPSNTDFHFYNNFPDFKSPVRDITAVAPSTISTIADSSVLRLGNAPFPRNDLDDALDWVVNLNDELLERFGASMDEFKQERAKEEENGKKSGGDENGFQLVQGKNKKKNMNEESTSTAGYSSTGVSVATKDKWTSGATKSKVPFHIPSIPRPQDEYRILVNNANLPFQHVWLEKSSDGSCFIHPLEKSSVMDFVDKTIGENEPEKPAQIESTPFKLVEELKDLKEMVAKLKEVNEFAVDLEHNQYRSFQGLTCLMQISTRTEDFVVDTLKLRIYIGSYLRDLFKDPSKRKVMHGADHDILWLQRDFGIYVCNLFDTGQASRVLQLERNSLEFLLHYFCDVTANKEYQNADWRLRPLPTEMVKYAREDTHYLLYIYDLMRLRLISESTIENDLLLEVHRRSDEICLKMYEKELFTDTSFLNLYGVQQTELNARQLAIVAGLYQWRDFIARSDDESTGYVLPNKSLIEIAKEMPATSDKLLRLVKSRHSYVERYLPSIIEIIRNSFSQSHAFESIASQLKQSQLDKAKAREGESGEQDRPVAVQMAPPRTPSVVSQIVTPVNNGKITASAPLFVPSQINNVTAPPKMASVQILKKPASFGALFAKPVKKPSFIFGSSVIQREESKSKLEKIKQSVALPFNFGAGEKPSLTNSTSNDTVMMQAPPPPPPSLGTESTQVQVPANPTITEDIIPLEVEKETKEDKEQDNDNSSDDNIQGVKHREWFPRQNEDEQTIEDSDDSDDSDVPTELSSSFEKCFKSISEMRNPQQTQRKPVAQNNNNMVSIQLEPFDYDAARKINKNKNDDDDEDVDIKNKNKERNRNSKIKRAASRKEKGERGGGGEKESGFQQPRRSQAFPMSGNRSTTYI